MQIPVMKSAGARPNWAEVSLSALRRNFAAIRSLVSPQAQVCAIVKCNAYGHGAVRCAQALQQEGASWFGVTSPQEAIELRQAGISGPILLLSSYWEGEEDAVLDSRLTPVVWSVKQIEDLERAAAAKRLPPVSVPIHLKLDTGMARLGLPLSQIEEFLSRVKSLPHLKLEGVLSHLASAEVLDASDAAAQAQRFEAALEQVTRAGFSPAWVHLANSAAIMARPATWKTLVRPGISLYGYHLPFASAAGGTAQPSHPLPLEPVLAWKCRIIGLRDVETGQALGYSAAYVTPRPARIAVIPAGYGDGLNRQLSSRGRVLVRGEFANIVGNVSMDLTLIDVSHISGIQLGDEVTLIGNNGDRQITAWEHATVCHTIPYEILCNISRRVSRFYVD